MIFIFRLRRLVMWVCGAVLAVYLAGEVQGEQWPLLVEYRGWLMVGAAVVAGWMARRG